ncbi:MAG TPA: hypothetical protein VE547_14305 [Mycobacteriales bacterium]|jgi:hypothetical protein|nr:hypothetical protein [Mycobacteriales bacterium]
MKKRREPDPDEQDYIADTLHRTEEELHAEAEKTSDPAAQHRRAEQVSANAERFRERARELRRPATDEDQ